MCPLRFLFCPPMQTKNLEKTVKISYLPCPSLSPQVPRKLPAGSQAPQALRRLPSFQAPKLPGSPQAPRKLSAGSLSLRRPSGIDPKGFPGMPGGPLGAAKERSDRAQSLKV